MEGTGFDEIDFFRRIGESAARALLIGRRALAIPCLDDLVTTKRFAARTKDLEDIRLLLALRNQEEGGP